MPNRDSNKNNDVTKTIRLGIDNDTGSASTNKRRQKKRTTIIIIGIIMVLFTGGLYVGHRIITQGNQNTVNNNISNNNINADNSDNNDNKNSNNTNSVDGGTSTNTKITDISNNTNENNDSSNSTNTNDGNNTTVDDGGPKHGTSSASMQATKDAEQYMQSHDANALSNTATNFLKAFFTYDQTTLSNGSWLTLCSSYVDQDGIKNDTDNVVYKRTADTDWCKRMSNYGLFTASVDSVEVKSVYATKSENAKQGTVGEYHPVVDVVITYNVTNDEPGEAAWWDGLSKRRVEYLVNFTQNNKVAGISKISDKELEVIRATSYMNGMTQ